MYSYKSYIKIILLLFLFDIIYIQSGLVNYIRTIRSIQKEDIHPKYFGLIVYLIMAFALNNMSNTPKEAALLGFVIYSIYNLTNYYIFNDWNINVAIPDTLWGTFLFGIVKYISL